MALHVVGNLGKPPSKTNDWQMPFLADVKQRKLIFGLTCNFLSFHCATDYRHSLPDGIFNYVQSVSFLSLMYHDNDRHATIDFSVPF